MRFGQLFQKALTGTVTMEVYKMQNPEDGKPTGNYIGTYVVGEPVPKSVWKSSVYKLWATDRNTIGVIVEDWNNDKN